MNEILFIVSILINFIGIIIAYKVFRKTGLFCMGSNINHYCQY